MWNWFWGIKEEERKLRPLVPPDYARPTLFIHTYACKTTERPPLDIELDITTAATLKRQGGNGRGVDDAAESYDGSDLPELLGKAIRQIDKRLAKLAAQWETDRQLSVDMAGGDTAFYGDETEEGQVMRSTVDVAGGSAPQLRVGCVCADGYRRSVAFGDMLADHDWPLGWVVMLKHWDLPDAAKQGKGGQRNSVAFSVRSGRSRKGTDPLSRDYLASLRF